ncbi:MAG: AhpC/TSA family protein [Flavobacteriales bacterium]|nr:AhpC/TSA family protein [Flavobacteriales bacterium]
MIKNWMITLAAMFTLAACGQKGAVVKGNLDNAEGEMIVLEKLSPTDVIATDSVEIGNGGDFKLSTGEITEPGFYRVRINQNNFVILLLNDGEKAELSGNALDFYRSYEVTGSEGSTKLRALDARLRKDYELQDSLRKSFMKFQAEGHPRLDSIAQSIDEVFKVAQTEKVAFVKDFIDQNPNSLATLSAIQSVRYDENSELFDKVASNLESVYPNSEYVKQFKKQLVDLKAKQQAQARTGVGAQAPEIVVQTPDGETIKLSDFKGKVTMIDFWASWCKPCRAENPNVVRVYNQYKDKGFEIFGVSLDQDKAKWIEAIKQDGLTWKHGSELQFWQSSFVPAYNLDGIPMTYLLDENGVIIAKGLRGQQLEAKLQEIFG